MSLENKTISQYFMQDNMQDKYARIKRIYTLKLRHFANKLQNACTRVLGYTFVI